VRTRTRKIVLGVATIVSALALAGPAQASTAAGDQYGAVLGEQSGGTGQGAGGLPFTGLRDRAHGRRNGDPPHGLPGYAATAGLRIGAAARNPHTSG
jgi:hypothetical protein